MVEVLYDNKILDFPFFEDDDVFEGDPRKIIRKVNGANIKFEVGILLCRDFRHILEERKFLGDEIEWIESKGILDHLFTIKGKASDIIKLKERFNALSS